MKTIRQLAGVPAAHWERLYLHPLHAYARFVQQLPASEAHHHAGPGGMLSHGLEVVMQALKLRRGHLLPHGASAEELAALQDLWTYATAMAALLHDLGKPVTDLQITLFNRSGTEQGYWDPLLGPMPEEIAWYRVEFRRGRDYGSHTKVVPLLVRFVIPEAGLAWLASNRELLMAWLATISGDLEAAGILGEIVSRADGLSVAADLAGEQGRFPTARQKPLHERLLTGLRYLLDQDRLPLNRKGAAGWVTGEELWLVSKRVLDLLKEHLSQEGQGGIPTRNDRLMDELQQHNVLIPNGERAIWTVQICIDDWQQSLTVLRIPVARLWPDPAARPAPFSGSVVPVNESTGLNGTAQSNNCEAEHDTEIRSDSTTSSVLEGSAAPASPSPESTAIPETASTTEEGTLESPAGDDDDAGTQFVTWLREGLADGHLAINEVNARIHTVQEGVLLISPGIFKDFAPDKWNHVQKRFQKLKLHLKTPQGTNIWTYQVIGARRQSRVKGVLIAEPEQIFTGVTLPPPNSHLSQLG